jgi:putative transcriptional regulator
LAKAGFSVSDRADLRPISFDMMARRDSTLLVLKVLGNADALNEGVAQELRTLAKFLEASPVVVAARSGGGDLEDGVVYTHRGVPVFTLGTLQEYLLENNAPMAFASPGGLYVNIRHEMLKLLRTQRALSLGLLAQVAGVSRRAIQMYEEGMHATIDSALRLEEFLGESLVEPIDPLRPTATGPQPAVDEPDFEKTMGDFEDVVMRMLRSVGFRVVPTRQSPFSALSQSKDTILTGVERKDASDPRRARLLSSVGGVSENNTMYVVGRETGKTSLHGTPLVQRRELEKLRDPDELLRLLEERRKKQRSP